MMVFSAERLKARAVELGFNLVGIARAEPSPQLAMYERWVEAGMHGAMGYMARPDRQARRRDLNVILPGVQSLVIVGVDYRSWLPEDVLSDPSRGRIASYAWGLDYHDLITPRLEKLADWLGAESSLDVQHRVYVDTGAILERSHAHEAGMGFIGKNTMLIHPRRGSYFFLGEILTNLEFDTYDQPGKATLCGSCTRCLTACPTNAFPRPHVLDSRLCISYLTIEHKGWIARDLRPQMGNWIFGCDICQDVCPWQRFTPETTESVFRAADLDRAAPRLLDVLAMDTDTFKARFHGSPIERIKRHRFVRNACIAAGNWGSPEAVPHLTRLLTDEQPVARGHAAWGLSQILGDDARPRLMQLVDRETDDDVKAELEALLD
jgi:epoxyqueuosine reductase